MELILERRYKTKDYTMGSLYLIPPEQGGLEGICSTLEPPIGTATETVTAGSRKAIAPGRYRIRMAWSQRFHQMLPRLENVPGRSGILIHAGNTVKDTVGCILVGVTPLLASPRGKGNEGKEECGEGSELELETLKHETPSYKEGRLVESRVTLNRLISLLNSTKQEVWITVK